MHRDDDVCVCTCVYALYICVCVCVCVRACVCVYYNDTLYICTCMCQAICRLVHACTLHVPIHTVYILVCSQSFSPSILIVSSTFQYGNIEALYPM